MSNKLRLSEIFGPTLQGEGFNSGRICYFIRMAGCDMNPACKWCDTLNSYNKNCGEEVDEIDIITKLDDLIDKNEYEPQRIVITGGNPCIQDLDVLIRMLRQINPKMEICIETQGTVTPDWLKMVDHITFSPKPPSSSPKSKGQSIDEIYEFCKECYDVNNLRIEIKIVVFDDKDLKYAIEVFKKMIHVKENFTIQIGTNMNSVENSLTADHIIKTLVDKSNNLGADVIRKIRILPQLHRVLNVQ